MKKFTDEEKKLYRAEKQFTRQPGGLKISQLKKMLSTLDEEQRQALADKYGITTVEGHRLSVYNQCLLIYQADIPFSVVGGFQQWKKANRLVKKGEHSSIIFVPGNNKKTDEVSENANDDDDIFFLTANVFDISQTVPFISPGTDEVLNNDSNLKIISREGVQYANTNM
ncbi:MAG: ArdC-like ssDNA-binding domain-containing protein [Ignavibacteriaceae bacterium]